MAKIAIIERCGDCLHRKSIGYDIECRHDGPMKTATVRPDSLPNWCPLQDGDSVGVLAPLEWSKVADYQHEADIYAVRHALQDGQMVWQWTPARSVGIFSPWNNPWQTCASLEDGKAACEAHYRARMFAPGGPPRKIGEGK